jgi:hypothetical protein
MDAEDVGVHFHVQGASGVGLADVHIITNSETTQTRGTRATSMYCSVASLVTVLSSAQVGAGDDGVALKGVGSQDNALGGTLLSTFTTHGELRL